MLHFPPLNRVIVCLLLCFLFKVFNAEEAVLDSVKLPKEVEDVKKLKGPLLTGKVAIVTGGASGIGRSVCQVLDREGALVIIADINDTGSQVTLDLLSKRNHTAIHTDVSVRENVTNLFTQVENKYGSVDIVVNSAGIVHQPSLVTNVSEEVFDKVMSVNLYGTYLVTQTAVRMMLEKENATGRVILNIASVSGRGGRRYLSAYSASKGAVIAFTKSVALEVVRKGIRVNTILPGFTDTPMTQSTPNATRQAIIAEIPMKRIATPLEMSETIVFMCGPRSTYMVGAAVLVSGGTFL
uniref:(3R)-3-hydroxyacyl-CoA dehydrogenase n=1 Tax=Ixodes ricinus TaxID=34613 RepID=A0A0K8R6P8_IXORI